MATLVFPHDGGYAIWNDFETVDNPLTPILEPDKAKIRDYTVYIQTTLQDHEDRIVLATQASGGGGLIYNTLAEITADPEDRTLYQKGEVVNDPTEANNGTYQQTSTGSGNVWVRIADLALPFAVGDNSTPLG